MLPLFFVLLPSFTYCQLDPTASNPPHGCANYGLCATNPDPTVTVLPSCSVCVCQNGTTGTDCSQIIDYCTANPCTGNGVYTCTNTVSGRVCSCAAGYTGSDCSLLDTDPCAPVPCQNGGACLTTSNTTYSCSCSSTYLPPNCEYQNPCQPSPCQNGGTCVSVYAGEDFYCTCPSLWYDKTCSSYNVAYDESTASSECLSYDKNALSNSIYTLITENSMTYSICQNLMETTYNNPPFTMFTVNYQNCYLSTVNKLNATPANGASCRSPCPGDPSQNCGTYKQTVVFTAESSYGPAPQNCSTVGDPCGSKTTPAMGMCVSVSATTNSEGYVCLCEGTEFVQGPNDLSCIASDICKTLAPCKNGGNCTASLDQSQWSCSCPEGYTGADCSVEIKCDPNPCHYGGTCTNTGTGFSCQCLDWYSGATCTEINTCQYANPCVNGTCVNNGTGIQIWPWCQCNPGYTGVNCSQMRNLCTETGVSPCMYNSTCTPSFMDYSCACIPGTSNKNCSYIINMCAATTNAAGNAVASQCNTKDSAAVCISGTPDTINTFSCNCSADWSDSLCDLNVIIEQVMDAIYGSMDMTLLPLLNNLLQTPAQISDMMPFMIGTLSVAERTNLSWSLGDMFYNAAYEEKELDLDRDFVQWNDVVLGNCFTFNHPNATVFYNTRSSEYQGGFRARLKLNQDEYAPWTDTASILVFIHFKDDYIMSESIRYNAEPNNEVIFFPFTNEYTRLGGVYGACVNSPSQVKSFYFPGAYTTDGCLRSCYQDMIESKCDCMDPRYPMAETASACTVQNMTCVDDATEAAGDPSTWQTCVCPLPCTNSDFSITWSKSSYRAETPNCIDPMTYDWDATCQSSTADSVTVVVNQPQLVFNLFQETPTMDFNKLIGSLGALLGVLMGICAITFIEIGVMVFRVLHSVMCKPKHMERAQ